MKNIKFCQEEREGKMLILKEITDKAGIENLLKAFYIQEKENLK